MRQAQYILTCADNSHLCQTHGRKYIFISYEYDTNSILTLPMKIKLTTNVQVFNDRINQLKQQGLNPKLYFLTTKP